MRSHKPTTTLIIRKGEKQTELINTEDYEQKMQGISSGDTYNTPKIADTPKNAEIFFSFKETLIISRHLCESY